MFAVICNRAKPREIKSAPEKIRTDMAASLVAGQTVKGVPAENKGWTVFEFFSGIG